MSECITIVSGCEVEIIEVSACEGGGATSFLLLTDTPADYTGQEGKLIKVNPTGDALIFGDPSGSSVSWGDVNGTLSNQTDLQNALDAKEISFAKNTGFNKDLGTIAGTVCEGNDSRLSDARTPTVHNHVEADISDLDKFTQAEVNALLTTLDSINEDDLGTPAADGYVLSSTIAGARSWVPPATGGSSDHGALTGLSDDDHPQYHNDARGDARYYTAVLLNSGQLDTRYYTEAEITVFLAGKSDTTHNHNTAYDSLGSASAVQGNLDSHTGDVNNPHSTTKTHVGLGNVDNTSDATKEVSGPTQTALDGKEDDLGNPTSDGDILSSTIAGVRTWITPSTGGSSDFVSLTDTPGGYTGQAGKLVKVNPTGDALIFGDPSGSSVSWGDVLGTLSNQTDLQNALDAKVNDSQVLTNVPVGAVFTDTDDHTNLSNIGTNTHAQIDTHIADNTIHFTMASINITESQISDLGVYALNTHNHTGVYEPVFSKNTAFNKDFGVLVDTVCEGNDGRLSDARTPTAHSHTESDISDLDKYTQAEVDAALVGKENAFSKNTAFNKDFGVLVNTVCEGNDSRLSDARTPTAHTHIEADITDLQSYLLNIESESINSLSNVFTAMSPIDGQVLTFDTTNGWQAETPASGVTDHTLLSNIGTNTHAQIDTHIGDASVHFTEASISIIEAQISDFGSYSPTTHNHDANYDALGAASAVQSNLDTHTANVTNPHSVTAAQVGAVGNDDTETGASSVVNAVYIGKADYLALGSRNATTLYFINGA